jgi:hypothetical protein
MDDVDAVQAQIARNMLASGDWVTARLDGVAYLEKSPLVYWMMAGSYRVFGVHDWAARLPLALAAVLLCWVTFLIGRWSFGEEAGLYAGLSLATCAGLYLFTRIQIPDATLTLTIALAIWACFRLLEPDESSPWLWSAMLGVAVALGVLLKGLIAIVFPVLAVVAYMAVTRQLASLAAWKRLRLGLAVPLCLLVAAPWHVLATLRNPPYFVFSMHSGPGDYRGFFWFYFFNEHLLRFLNLRYPRDYNTVPRPLFWALNLVWIFPWTAYLVAAARQSFSSATRAGRVRLLALCWIGAVMVFFTFSTTQEYYSMPIYPALALLVGSAMAEGGRWIVWATRVTAAMFLAVFAVLSALLIGVWRIPAPGQMWTSLTQNPALYTLSLGHMADLTFRTFAYLKLPLAVAALAFGLGTAGLWVMRKNVKATALVLAGSMAIFFQASRLALVRFENYLGSYPLAVALEQSPPGQLIEADAYYAFSSVFFYTNRTALLLDGRVNNLEYGSYAPDAPHVFIDDSAFKSIWSSSRRAYLLTYGDDMKHWRELVGADNLHAVAECGGNYLLTNRALR